jgi:hypothetical protein
MTQRDSQLSGQKAQEFASSSDTKLGRAATSTLLMSKCVPKSKINLTDVIKTMGALGEGESYHSSL